MYQPFKRASLIALAAVCIGCVSFSNTYATATRQPPVYDTVPGKMSPDDLLQNLDFDKHMQQLDKALQQLGQQLKHTDWSKMQADLKGSLSKIDMKKIQQQIDAAMQKVDMQKVQLETQEALRKIDMKKIQDSIQKAMSDLKNDSKWQ